MSEPTYELRLRGPISRRTLSTFEEIDMRTDTIVSGAVTDHTALCELLERIGCLGFEIIEVHHVSNTHRAPRRPVDP